jgi:hypothetical protein
MIKDIFNRDIKTGDLVLFIKQRRALVYLVTESDAKGLLMIRPAPSWSYKTRLYHLRWSKATMDFPRRYNRGMCELVKVSRVDLECPTATLPGYDEDTPVQIEDKDGKASHTTVRKLLIDTLFKAVDSIKDGGKLPKLTQTWK